MTTVDLPFGRTQVTVDELHEYIDRKTASKELASADVPNADNAVESFIQAIPPLLEWLEEYGREYPWRLATDSWHIYATEILLQRTRSDAVADLYADFFDCFPDPQEVITAEEIELENTVRPLGFANHRVRTLREAAELCAEYDGEVPEDLQALQRPWRVGPYTARACLLFAFDEPLALVDTNTARITGRVFDYPLPAQPHKSTRVYRLLDALVPSDPALARAFNLALLDLGALICTNDNPECPSCSLAPSCTYFKEYWS
ncbi:hypothetical protein [Haloarchaeobius amylolyticus]|uniref:hypothetical protein n=1 Tax=Haloarchaeobius amylolyticus TaxID=1198296 RepID=UPI0022715314|nr:hypothetical protein [Haloarchaeobius amylolyticus]